MPSWPARGLRWPCRPATAIFRRWGWGWFCRAAAFTAFHASAYTAAALSAAELGDREVHDACLAALEAECPSRTQDGVIHRRRASAWAHGAELMVRATVRDSFRNLIEHGLLKDGPRLEVDDYPRVLVAPAHGDGDGLRAGRPWRRDLTRDGLDARGGVRLTSGGGVAGGRRRRGALSGDARRPLRLTPETA